uniref:Zgc:113363 n=1 Tax=Scleropages formosus TaxID=113540 RepID=A0A8C9TTZ0_SCLFO
MNKCIDYNLSLLLCINFLAEIKDNVILEPSVLQLISSVKADMHVCFPADCCVHCVLACLFCELLSLCSVLMQCLACGQGCETLCCCGGGATGGVACGENSCTAALDCGMLEDCCESSDCLEICLECCSICFPA